MAVHPARARSLPAEVLVSLRLAFGAERDERLPALRAALADDAAPTGEARRAAHSLASSAVVVGEPRLAEMARDVEERIDAGRAWRDQGRLLVHALASWAP